MSLWSGIPFPSRDWTNARLNLCVNWEEHLSERLETKYCTGGINWSDVKVHELLGIIGDGEAANEPNGKVAKLLQDIEIMDLYQLRDLLFDSWDKIIDNKKITHKEADALQRAAGQRLRAIRKELFG